MLSHLERALLDNERRFSDSTALNPLVSRASTHHTDGATGGTSRHLMTQNAPDMAQWHERTVARSLKAARQRAISKGNRFIVAAVELLRTTGKADFTVQEVVDGSGMSLRSFYHHFATKDDLLLALVEETMQPFIAAVRVRVDAESEPVEKLRVFLTTMCGSEETDDPASRGLVLFHWHLADARTDEFAATLRPQVDMLEEILEQGVAEGVFRTDVSVTVLAGLMTHTLLSLIDKRILGVHFTAEGISKDDLVSWCLVGLRPPPD